jgi:hypothetical protein
LIKWENMPVEQATWEDAAFIQRVFPGFQPWGQDCCRSGGVVMPGRGHQASVTLGRRYANQRPEAVLLLVPWTGPIVTLQLELNHSVVCLLASPFPFLIPSSRESSDPSFH